MDGRGTILAPVDFAAHSRAAAIRACELARSAGASIRLVHALDLPALARRDGPAEHLWDELRKSEQARLDALARDLAHRGAPVSARLEEGTPTRLIENAIGEADVELVVVGTRGDPGLDRVLQAGVAAQAIRAARAPVCVVKENGWDAAGRIRRVLVATDFSSDAEHAVVLAMGWARCLEADVEVFHALDPTGADDEAAASARAAALDLLQAILSRMREVGVPASAELGYGPVADAIVRRAEQSRADLLILGRRGRSRILEGLCGSVTARVLREAACSVMLAMGAAVGTGRAAEAADPGAIGAAGDR